MVVMGLMSGTSADGVDAVLARIEGRFPGLRVRLLFHHFRPYPSDLRERVFRASCPEGGITAEVAQLNFEIGRFFGEVARETMERAGIRPDLIASHGQTLCHVPRPDPDRGWRTPSTLQVGEGSVIAEITGVPVVSDFRTADMAAGGQGAPLVPFADFVLYRHPEKSRSIHNLGGISNLTYLPRGKSLEAVIAFDTGPGNMLIDGAARRFFGLDRDPEGKLAARGRVHEDRVQRLLAHPYFRLPPPKSTGREDFGWALLDLLEGLSGEDALATVTAFTARSIVDAYRRFILPHGLDEVIVGGGGARNRTLMRWIREGLAPVPVYTFEEMGWNSKAREALAFCILGYQTFHGEPSNVPQATGARHPAVLGKLSYPPPSISRS